MSGIYSDPRYEALGLTDTTQARAADQFYGSLQSPQGMGGMYGGANQFGGFQDEDDLQVAYEQDIIGRMSKIDPTTPDYEYQIQGFLAAEPDPNVASYGRVRNAASALLGRSQLLRQTAQKSMQDERTIRSQLAENGFDPDRFTEITRPDGRLDLDRAYYQLGELKRTNGLSGKLDPAKISAQENEELIKLVAPLNVDPSDEEKILAWQQITGESGRPETTQQWNDAYNAVMSPRRSSAKALVQTYRQLGRNVPTGILEAVGLQESVVPSTSNSQSNPPPPTPPTPPANDTFDPPVDPNSPNISLGEAARAERELADAQAESAVQQGANQEWTNAKNNLEGRLLSQFGGDRNRLNQFYRSVLARESAGEGEAEVSYMPDEYDPTLQLPVGERTLREIGVDPSGVPAEIPNSRGFFSGGKVSNEEVLRSLVQDRLSSSPSQSASLPKVNTKEERDALPVGARYILPDGRTAVKQ